MTEYHLFAAPVTATTNEPVIEVGIGETIEDAIAACRAAGYTVIEEGNGGSYDRYDAEDAPGVYGFEPDGLGGISITVEAD